MLVVYYARCFLFLAMTEWSRQPLSRPDIPARARLGVEDMHCSDFGVCRSTSLSPSMTMSLSHVPTELLQTILAFALDDHPCPGQVLCVNRTFLALGQPLLHGHLHFRSINQLSLFAKGSAPLACAPRTVAIALAGGSADFEVFRHLMGVLKRCQRSRTIAAGQDSSVGHIHAPGHANGDSNCSAAQVALDLLSLRLHSHSSNPHLGYIYEALSLAK